MDRKYLMIIVALGSFLTPFMGSSVVVALPAIGKEFSMSAVGLAWVSTAYLLAAAAFLVPMGRISDIYGRKKIFVLGIAVYSAASLLSLAAASSGVLIISRLIQGLSGAMIFATPVALLTSVYPPEERGMALGYNVAAVYLGLSLGPFFGGILTQQFGWRSIFIAHAALGFATLAASFWKLRGVPEEKVGEKFDFFGSVLYAVSLAALMYGFSALPAFSGIALMAAGVAGLAVFWTWEEKVEHPIFEANLFMRNRFFAFSNLAALVNYSATAAVGFLLSLYLQYIKGFDPRTSGFILVIQPAIQAAFSPLAGKLSDRIEPRIVASSGMALTAFGLFLLVFLSSSSPVWFVAVCLAFLGFGFALFSSPNTNAVMSSVEKKQYGVASGILGTMRLTGQMFSMGIATMVLALYIGSTQIAESNYSVFMHCTRLILASLAAMCFCGIFFSLARGRVRKGV